jgi:hypothetical protein
MKVLDWINDWVALWPADVKSGGESIRTAAKYCVNKMVKFCRDNPQYDKDCIFAATRHYLQQKRAADWFGVRRATYFIGKLGVGSDLEAYCEQVTSPRKEKEAFNPPIEYDPLSDYI